MRDLWGADPDQGQCQRCGTDPSDQLLGCAPPSTGSWRQVQELSQVLLKAQSEALAVLNDAATANAQALGGAAPNFAEMQKTVTEAMQNASRRSPQPLRRCASG